MTSQLFIYTVHFLRSIWSFRGIEHGYFREQHNRLLPFAEYQLHNFVAFEIDSSKPTTGKIGP